MGGKEFKITEQRTTITDQPQAKCSITTIIPRHATACALNTQLQTLTQSASMLLKFFSLSFVFFRKGRLGGGHSIQTFVQTLKSSVLPSLGELGKKKCMMQHNLRKELKWYCSPPSLPSALCLCHFLLSGHFSQQPVGRPIPLYSCHHVRLTRLSKLHFSELSTPALNTIRYHR